MKFKTHFLIAVFFLFSSDSPSLAEPSVPCSGHDDGNDPWPKPLAGDDPSLMANRPPPPTAMTSEPVPSLFTTPCDGISSTSTLSSTSSASSGAEDNLSVGGGGGECKVLLSPSGTPCTKEDMELLARLEFQNK
ncbi:hypothetical protein CDAR_272951 [Caerostris darwini]|uniref:Uncharacterized protein n=1 Tax=Caerostris darwini TaxID=1538125 RepID=A0AAV4MG70_9ARAC|nr:hypothetical protein CDAR_272951 [Caerostris darwini]